MMWRKSCPRCRGDLVLDSDHYGQYVSCIQCGNILSDRQHRSLLQPSTRVLPRPSPGAVEHAVVAGAGVPEG